MRSTTDSSEWPMPHRWQFAQDPVRSPQVLQRRRVQEGVRRPGVDLHGERHRARERPVEDGLRLHDGRRRRELVQRIGLRDQPADLRRGHGHRQRQQAPSPPRGWRASVSSARTSSRWMRRATAPAAVRCRAAA